MSSILIFIVILGVIVFVHELGHFVMAKRAGMRVDEFGFGFPPRIFGYKRGGTIYSLNLIPIGGFVKIKGENGEEAWDADSFGAKKWWRRVSVILAGVTMNVILAFLLFTAGYLIGVPQDVSSFPADAKVGSLQVWVGEVLPGSPAEKAGIKSGDIIIEADGVKIVRGDALRAAIKNASGQMEILALRGGKEISFSAKPEKLAQTDAPALGIGLMDIGTVRYAWYLAPVRAAQTTVTMLWNIAASFVSLIGRIFSGQGVGADVSGPVGIAVVTGAAAKIGFAYLLEFTALLSLNLAVINIIPFPALDGGRFLFLVIERLRGRAVSRKVEGIMHQAGFVALMLLILAVTYGDLVKYGGAITGFLKGIL
jgi:regulator of sigma E protease